MNSKRKILLLTPPYPVKERLGKLGILGSHLPSIGLLYLATALRSTCDVAIIDAGCSNSSKEDILSHILQRSPDIVGISAVTPAITRAQDLAASIKQAVPHTLVVLGGPHITTVPKETMDRTPAVDVGVIGEGERTMQEIVNVFDGTVESLQGVPGTVVRLPSDKSLVINPARELIGNIDELGLPAYDLVASQDAIMPALFKTRRLPAIHAITSRGCTHTCTFCNTNLFNKRVRFHSPEYVISLIEHLVSLGYREIAFEDDNFTAQKTRLAKVCNSIIDNRIDISWSANARIDTVDERMLSLMKEAGCWYISYGIESGSQETLDRINKKITLAEIRRKVTMTRQVGIAAKGFFIIGFPWETEQTIQETVDFALSLDLSDLNIFPLTPFPGTAVYEQAKMEGSFDDDWSRMDLQQIVYVPPGLTGPTLQSQIRKLLLRFYLRPGTIANYLRRAIGAHAVFLKLAKEFLKR
jgi:anaerobic magnesium-protoporphyrin IX monomethyl ester cyclase